MRLLSAILISIFLINQLFADDGYRLWLKYELIQNEEIREHYQSRIHNIFLPDDSQRSLIAHNELRSGLKALLGNDTFENNKLEEPSIFLTITGYSKYVDRILEQKNIKLGPEGFLIINHTDDSIYIVGGDQSGMLYGVFRFLRHVQMQRSLDNLFIIDAPKLDLRVLNHWDNLDGTVERGYAGFSIWNWHQLPDYIDKRYIDYARANASIGINGTVLTNVNANALVFREDYIDKATALADVFRPYGIKVYLTARFSAPIELGGLRTADPLDPEVQEWWRNKVAEIYKAIPDFGGFLVKANSEGQPGPQEYGRSHADGANMLADALQPYDGIVMWRAFVYSEHDAADRAKQAFNEFVPLDGKFRDNVVLQVKNGPIDFQPREPIHPLFGAMPNTPLMMEFQITKEYLGQGTHLVGMSNMYEEVLQTDTHLNGPGTTVSKIIDGSAHDYPITGMAGVANIGTARNWTGNYFGQADWYSFGRLAWDPDLTTEEIFDEWTRQTFESREVQKVALDLLNDSYETCVKYMTPLGLHHIMATGHHYGPGPWVGDLSRPEWNPVYYHQSDSIGIGFNRTVSGSQALQQYHSGFQNQYDNLEKCPEEFLLWFHHVPWNYKLKSGNTLWDQICLTYDEGVSNVKKMKASWMSIKDQIDKERYEHVLMHLNIQEKEAQWWRDACLSYFHSFSKMDYPEGCTPPMKDLAYYQSLTHPYAPGIRPRW